MIQHLARRKRIIVGAYVVLCVGLVLLFAGFPRSTKRGFDTGAVQHLDALISANDPLARNILVVVGLFQTYQYIFGRFATLEQIQQDGYGFFELKNPYKGLPVANRCDRPSPGDYCLYMPDPYTIEKLVFYDRDGNEIEYPGFRNLQIPLNARDHPYSWVDFFASHPSKDQIKVFVLGRLLNRVVWDIPAAKADNGAGFLRLLKEPPFHQLHDTCTGKTLPFDGSGYGDRVKFTPSSNGAWFTTIYLPDGSIGYREEFRLVANGSEHQPFSIIRVPQLAGATEPATNF